MRLEPQWQWALYGQQQISERKAFYGCLRMSHINDFVMALKMLFMYHEPQTSFERLSSFIGCSRDTNCDEA